MRGGFAEIANSTVSYRMRVYAKFELRNRAKSDRARSKTKSTSTKESVTIEDDCVDLGLLLRSEDKWQGCRKTLMIMTEVVREFFLSEDIVNFTIKNEDSSLAAKPLWVPGERHGNFHLALALGLGQTAIGPLMEFYRDMSMSCEFGSKIDEKNAEGFSFRVFSTESHSIYRRR